MPLHCSYCHKPNHSRLDCPVRASICCWHCLTTGHLRKQGPKRPQQANPNVSSAPPVNKPKKATETPGAMEVEPTPSQSSPSSSLDKALKKKSPDAFARALRGG
ncbi:hypothetical protein [Absidia glauca]|uniref:CCHC-type domain-containing protein n=1 Tax=Absidia glauca TaxID=4829 RepID=A0A163M282_ABSGL|nr:hypothetical protein [Absidia glauca]